MSLSRAAFVIAGGQSSRMGTDKAFLDFRGQTLLERSLATLRTVTPNFAISGIARRFASFGDVIEDIYANCGPLGAIHAVLSRSTADLNLVLAVDMPFVTSPFLSYLLGQAERTPALVTVPRVLRRFQPLCAVYRRQFAPIADKALAAGEYKIDALFADTITSILEDNSLARAGFSASIFRNLNTPEDLQRALTDLPES